MNILGRQCEVCLGPIPNEKRLGTLTCGRICRQKKKRDNDREHLSYVKLDKDLRLIQVHEDRFVQAFCDHCNCMEQFVVSHDTLTRRKMTCSICFIHKEMRL